ncbi:hypothetical protein KC19_VG266900 [Ceratodon purpureus]|uniref:Uncharacterized protein n=1 Tax=Ceratodon purpureus TaxID=3225 RepID=A0A8T0HUN4_CERPU|nr:hypothetical protein KC19_VG266900 [Ceratodon purpureus]
MQLDNNSHGNHQNFDTIMHTITHTTTNTRNAERQHIRGRQEVDENLGALQNCKQRVLVHRHIPLLPVMPECQLLQLGLHHPLHIGLQQVLTVALRPHSSAHRPKTINPSSHSPNPVVGLRCRNATLQLSGEDTREKDGGCVSDVASA